MIYDDTLFSKNQIIQYINQLFTITLG